MTILAGTSGFAFKEWKGPFYPEKMKNDDMLGFYAGKFPTVEINNTFYRLPKEAVLTDWAAQVPESFKFAIKASQKITHFARLKPESADAVAYLLKVTKALGARLGPILFQLPPNLKKDFDRLNAFVAKLPAEAKYAIEFRHESWFTDDVYALLRSRDIALGIIEQEEFSSPVVTTASWGYARLHRFDYDAARLAEWAGKIKAMAWSDAYVYFKHDEGVGSGPPAVDGFMDALGA
ncbi:MAG TPA: DUF72 domain-containing protein [Gemmatimonadaceae bacterium]|jgi:uncharacterized protein YecE (DUF72 family)|nr:DUF72 domain-containing protein [Gemmatimonadaceae bacterium]